MMTSGSTASTWVKFFSNAGISSPENAKYAHIFVENRITIDMLTEINKDHLREMGINRMGDIICILRHSKAVSDQTVRDKILAEDSGKTVAKVCPTVSSSVSSSTVLPNVISRRVLPEHEGKYKISLPKGSTTKSREILAKHSAMQSDKMEKKSIFDRLNMKNGEMADSTSSDTQTKVSSIFNRLGSYKEIDRRSMAFSGILKSPQKTTPKGIVKHRVQRVITKPTITHSIQRAESSSDAESDDKMDSDDFKQVSFSEDVEVRVFNPPLVKKNNLKILKGLRSDGIQSRLSKKDDQSSSFRNLNNIKKISMKPGKVSPSGKALNGSKMKSDQIALQAKSVHSRLDLKNRKSAIQLTNQIKNFKLDAPVLSSKGSSSVFNRLGNKQK